MAHRIVSYQEICKLQPQQIKIYKVRHLWNQIICNSLNQFKSLEMIKILPITQFWISNITWYKDLVHYWILNVSLLVSLNFYGSITLNLNLPIWFIASFYFACFLVRYLSSQINKSKESYLIMNYFGWFLLQLQI